MVVVFVIVSCDPSEIVMAGTEMVSEPDSDSDSITAARTVAVAVHREVRGTGCTLVQDDETGRDQQHEDQSSHGTPPVKTRVPEAETGPQNTLD
jgi:hypothetical protein